jgi:hypothetical protein
MQAFIVKAIVKLYFIGALAVSFNHIVTAAHKLQLLGWQAWTTPFAIDGIAVIGMVMRSEKWSTETNRIGFRVQMGAGALSLACNVFAGNTLGERIYGVLVVALFIFSEWLSDRLVTRATEVKAIEVAELEALAAQPTAEELAAQKRSEIAKKAAETRKRNAARKERERKAQAKALEALVTG